MGVTGENIIHLRGTPPARLTEISLQVTSLYEGVTKRNSPLGVESSLDSVVNGVRFFVGQFSSIAIGNRICDELLTKSLNFGLAFTEMTGPRQSVQSGSTS